MNDSFSSLIDSAKSVLVLLPQKPYFDQVAAGLSLYLSIHDKKEVAISCPTPMTVEANRLVGVNKISTEMGSKNLSIAFPNYDPGNIEKVSYDIENGEFKLTVVPKAGLPSPTREQMKIDYSGVAADLVILIGGANEAHFPQVASPDLEGATIVHIGTRALTGFQEKGVMSLARPASSVSEIVAGIIKDGGLPMDVDCATNLVAGIEEGSNHFESGEVTPETFEVFAYLLRNGGRRIPKQRLTPGSFPPGSIPTKPFGQIKNTIPAPKQVSQQSEPILEQIEQKEEIVENPPSDWLQPKVYKGTSIS